MPSTPVHTLLDVQRHTATPLDTRIVDDVIADDPLINLMPARTIAGTTFQYRRRTSIPKCGFRPANTGNVVHKTSYETRVDKCYILSGLIAVDKAIIAADGRGEAALLTEESQQQTRGTLFGMAQQSFYGKKLDPNGFDGFDAAIGDYMTISADPSLNTADAELPESGASVWAICLKPEAIQMIYGNSKGIDFGPIKEGLLPDADGNSMNCKYRDLLALPGLVVKSEYALGRIRNESASNPLTDDKLAELIDLFPDSHKPTHIFMTRATRARLRKSRSAVITVTKKVSGETTSAETPTEYEGIPILTSEALLNDETPENIAAASVTYLEAKKNRTLPRR